MKQFDFSGWATRNNLKCSDGRTIMKDAFKDNDGQVVPLVWNHQHNDSLNVLGHALLENRKDGVYAYCTFNDTDAGRNAKLLVEHGDVSALSIYANQLKQMGANVLHGAIREVSLVLAGANPGAFIDAIMSHSDSSDEEIDSAIIYTGENISIYHSNISETSEEKEPEVEETKTEEPAEPEEEKIAHASTNQEDSTMANDTTTTTGEDKTIADVFNSMTKEQQDVVYFMIGQALEDAGNGEGDENMKHNVFDQEDMEENNVLSHSEMEDIITDAKRYGSLKESVLEHGITDIDYLFPDAQNLDTPPSLITREMSWVSTVMNAVHHTPFSRIKSTYANLTEAEARAKGYIKGKQKVEEVFGLLKRSTTPTTIYKKQKLDRDDVVDITDFDVVAWLKSEMRLMLDEEIARAALVGDGRQAASDDKINEQNIRPIWTDDDLFTIKAAVNVSSTATADQKAKEFIRTAVKSRKNYKGSGNPVMFTTEDTLTDCLLMEDTTGRVIYDSVEKLATAMRVSSIVTVPVMEGLTRVDGDTKTRTLMGIIVNLADYNIGADKGGAVNMFDDFDIDYNAQKYLIETRCSGALTKPYSAIALEELVAAAG